MKKKDFKDLLLKSGSVKQLVIFCQPQKLSDKNIHALLLHLDRA